MPAKKNSVTIYSTPTCSYCKMAKEYFKEHKIDFKEIDVAADSMAAQDMIRKSGQSGVPVIEVNGNIIIGFDKPALKKALNIS